MMLNLSLLIMHYHNSSYSRHHRSKRCLGVQCFMKKICLPLSLTNPRRRWTLKLRILMSQALIHSLQRTASVFIHRPEVWSCSLLWGVSGFVSASVATFCFVKRQLFISAAACPTQHLKKSFPGWQRVSRACVAPWPGENLTQDVY